MSNKEIVAYLNSRGAAITEKNFRLIFSNPFYLKANNIMQQYPNAGKPKLFKHDEVPLKIFTKNEISNQPLTGYKTKANWYYKTKKTTVPINIKAQKLNSLFVNYLSDFEYKKEYQPKF